MGNGDSKAVRDLIEIGDDYGEYGDAHDYARDVGRAADAIEDLIDAGGAAHAIGVARDAIRRFLESQESVDDSSGSVGGAGHGLFAAHLRACQSASPDPLELSQYLADLLLGDEYEYEYGFEFDLGDYRDLLGDASLDDRGLAHLRIARELDRAGRGAEALGWAGRGLEEATRPEAELVEYVAARYAAADRPGDVLAQRRTRFHASPALEGYQALRQAATACGAWPSEREAALTALREDARSSSSISGAQNGSALFDVLLDEGDLDAAWAAAEQAVVTAPGSAGPGGRRFGRDTPRRRAARLQRRPATRHTGRSRGSCFRRVTATRGWAPAGSSKATWPSCAPASGASAPCCGFSTTTACERVIDAITRSVRHRRLGGLRPHLIMR
jgi:hypothetical protein